MILLARRLLLSYYLCTSVFQQYANPNYGGDQIGEYEFYVDGKWDNSTCVGEECTLMDCHDPYSSSWELIGIYKETVDFGDNTFYEQLFKHQGFCLWDGDKEDHDADDTGSGYRFMQEMRRELPSGCTQIDGMINGTQSNYYIAIKPLSRGDTTLGVYLDSSCLEESAYSFEDYQTSDDEYLASSGSTDSFDTWNANMDVYKVCQPCRAYNLQPMYEADEDEDHQRRRNLQGEGESEKNYHNCHDDAGYQNCNQCFKFETHTDMAEASSDDLMAASEQGTILLIEYNGTWYGKGMVGDTGQENSSGDFSMRGRFIAAGHTLLICATLLLCGFAVTKAYQKITKRRITLSSEDGSRTPPPLV